MTSITAPGAVRWIVRTLEEAGHETWAVGGAVRDVLAGIESVDWDLATRARPQQVRRLFRRTVPIGIEHGTVGVLARDGTLYEVTTFRKDVETFGRHAVVEFSDRLEDDLSRRDFTINAVAWHPLNDELRDPFGGMSDLEAGVLRTVGRPRDRFAEDYLRVLRALRFAGRYDLSVEEGTWRALSAVVDRLPDLSPERVREELMKVLGKDPRPSRALALYAASGALEAVHPELAALLGPGPDRPRAGAGRPLSGRTADTGEDEGPPGPDRWTVATLTADVLPVRRPLLRLAAMLLDAGEPEDVPGQPEREPRPAAEAARPAAAHGSERAARRAAALLTRLRFSNADTDRVVALVGLGVELPLAGEGRGASDETLRRWLARVGEGRVRDVLRLAGARARVRAVAGEAHAVDEVVRAARALRGELRRRPPLAVGDLSLDGRDLIRMGLKPGPRFGQILEALLDRVLTDPALDEPEILAEIVRRELAPAEPGEPGGPDEAHDAPDGFRGGPGTPRSGR